VCGLHLRLSVHLHQQDFCCAISPSRSAQCHAMPCNAGPSQSLQCLHLEGLVALERDERLLENLNSVIPESFEVKVANG